MCRGTLTISAIFSQCGITSSLIVCVVGGMNSQITKSWPPISINSRHVLASNCRALLQLEGDWKQPLFELSGHLPAQHYPYYYYYYYYFLTKFVNNIVKFSFQLEIKDFKNSILNNLTNFCEKFNKLLY